MSKRKHATSNLNDNDGESESMMEFKKIIKIAVNNNAYDEILNVS